MKRFFYIFGFVLLIVVSVNIYVDPAHLIKAGDPQSDELKIAGILLDGQQAVATGEKIGFDERITRKIYLENKKNKDSSVIFGSSRVRYFSSLAFNDQTHFVDALNASTLEDLLVLTYLREQAQLFPKRMVIALDPWMIEKKNDYAHLVQVSYPETFVKAVDFYKFTLPKVSGDIYKNMSGRTQQLVPVPLKLRPGSGDTSDNFQEHVAGQANVTGSILISFNAKIESGTYNWAWRIVVNGLVKDSGNYMDNIQGSPAPHEYRTVVTKVIDIKQGDTIALEMAHANNDGWTVPKGVQQYRVEDFSINLKCSDPVATKFKNLTDCDGFLQPKRLKKYALIVRELISPAYFQESLKISRSSLTSSNGPHITAKKECVPDVNQSSNVLNPSIYVFCSDGSVPWPLREKHDVAWVDSIVRTIDDHLVPLKNVDENALELLRQITELYRGKGIEVKYVLIPVHPFSYEKWFAENDSRGFVKAEAVYRDFAKRHGIHIYGSYNPGALGWDNTCFRDWVHPLPWCTNRLVKDILQ